MSSVAQVRTCHCDLGSNHGREDFLDRRLGSFEILLDRLVKTVAEGRARLTIVAQQPAHEVSLEDDSGNLFNQDEEF